MQLPINQASETIIPGKYHKYIINLFIPKIPLFEIGSVEVPIIFVIILNAFSSKK